MRIRVPIGRSRAAVFAVDAVDGGLTPLKASLGKRSGLNVENVEDRENGDDFGEGHD